MASLGPCNRAVRFPAAVWSYVSVESEFRVYVKIPNTCPAEDKGQLSKGLRGEVTGCPAVHLSSINGVTEDRVPLPLQPTVLPLASFSAARQHLASRLILAARPNPF